MISLIIPTYNRADLLRSALVSLIEQRLEQSRFEIIVVNNGSTDNTNTVIDEFNTQFTNFCGIYAPEPGLHTGRHVGMNAAKGDILVFADDDIEALPSWLSSIEEAFEDEQVAMVGGNNYPLFMELPPKWLMSMWERNKLLGFKSISSLSVIEFTKKPKAFSPYQIWGCNFAIRKKILLEAGGFHPDGMPKELIRFRGDGETHVSRHVANSGYKCVFHPGASVRHKITPERMTFQYLRQRGFSQGVSDSFSDLRGHKVKKLKNNKLTIKVLISVALEKIISLQDNKEAKHAFMELSKGYKEGYEYHQNEYRNDLKLREWVHRTNYY